MTKTKKNLGRNYEDDMVRSKFTNYYGDTITESYDTQSLISDKKNLSGRSKRSQKKFPLNIHNKLFSDTETINLYPLLKKLKNCKGMIGKCRTDENERKYSERKSHNLGNRKVVFHIPDTPIPIGKDKFPLPDSQMSFKFTILCFVGRMLLNINFWVLFAIAFVPKSTLYLSSGLIFIILLFPILGTTSKKLQEDKSKPKVTDKEDDELNGHDINKKENENNLFSKKESKNEVYPSNILVVDSPRIKSKSNEIIQREFEQSFFSTKTQVSDQLKILLSNSSHEEISNKSQKELIEEIPNNSFKMEIKNLPNIKPDKSSSHFLSINRLASSNSSTNSTSSPIPNSRKLFYDGKMYYRKENEWRSTNITVSDVTFGEGEDDDKLKKQQIEADSFVNNPSTPMRDSIQKIFPLNFFSTKSFPERDSSKNDPPPKTTSTKYFQTSEYLTVDSPTNNLSPKNSRSKNSVTKDSPLKVSKNSSLHNHLMPDSPIKISLKMNSSSSHVDSSVNTQFSYSIHSQLKSSANLSVKNENLNEISKEAVEELFNTRYSNKRLTLIVHESDSNIYDKMLANDLSKSKSQEFKRVIEAEKKAIREFTFEDEDISRNKLNTYGQGQLNVNDPISMEIYRRRSQNVESGAMINEEFLGDVSYERFVELSNGIELESKSQQYLQPKSSMIKKKDDDSKKEDVNEKKLSTEEIPRESNSTEKSKRLFGSYLTPSSYYEGSDSIKSILSKEKSLNEGKSEIINKRTVSFSPILTHNYSIDDDAKSERMGSVKTPNTYYTTRETPESKTSVLSFDQKISKTSIKKTSSLPNQNVSSTPVNLFSWGNYFQRNKTFNVGENLKNLPSPQDVPTMRQQSPNVTNSTWKPPMNRSPPGPRSLPLLNYLNIRQRKTNQQTKGESRSPEQSSKKRNRND